MELAFPGEKVRSGVTVKESELAIYAFVYNRDARYSKGVVLL